MSLGFLAALVLTPTCHVPIQDGIQRMGVALEKLAGTNAGPAQRAKLQCMQKEARRVFVEHMSYLHNPQGVTTSILFEAWVLLQRRGLLKGPYAGRR